MPKHTKKKEKQKVAEKGHRVVTKVVTTSHHHKINALLAKAAQIAGESKGSFLSVSTDEKGKASVTPLRAGIPDLSVLRDLMRGMLHGSSLKIDLVQRATATGVTLVNYSTVLNLTPSSGSGFTNLSGIFDVCRCTGVTIDSTFNASTTPSSNYTAAGAVAFDPANNGSLTQVVDAMEAKYHVGPVKLGNLYGNMSPNVSTATGYLKWHGVTAPVLESGFVADLVGSNWFPTAATSAIVGFLKPFLETVGAPTVTFVHFITYHMEFAYQS